MQKDKRFFSLSIINLDQFRSSGGHVGHRFSAWRPAAMGLKHFQNVRGGFVLFNLHRSGYYIQKAFLLFKKMSQRGSVVLYIDSGKVASSVIKSAGLFSNIPYISTLWIGGILTNFRETVYKLRKSNQSLIKKNRKTLPIGLLHLDFVPEIIVSSSEFYSPFAIAEANTLSIPSISIVDSNLAFIESTYPIPLNDDSFLTIKSLFFIFSSAYWFGRADFAMRYLKITNSFLLKKILKNNSFSSLFLAERSIKSWSRGIKLRKTFVSANTLTIVKLFQ